MDRQREKFVAEMNRMREAMKKTKSEYLKNDYRKALLKMKKELKDYDDFRRKAEM